MRLQRIPHDTTRYTSNPITLNNISKYQRIGSDYGVASDTKLLIRGVGANNSTSITDDTGKTVTVYGDTKISTDQKIIGDSSIYFDGTDSALIPASSTDYDFGVSPFTIDVWVCPTQNQTDWRSILSANGSAGGWLLYFYSSSSIAFRFGINTRQLVDNLPLTNNVFQHIAVVRNSDNGYIFINGALRQTITGLVSVSINQELPLRIGQNSNSTEDLYKYIGYLSHIRITKGRALWTTNFTPPNYYNYLGV